MEVFRISHEKWAGVLQGSGKAARWNSNGMFITYSASTRALACLEMLVHLSGEQIKTPFKLAVVYIPDEISIENFSGFYNSDWAEIENYHNCQIIGDEWIRSQRTSVLRAPSAIIKNEFNYLINPQHPDFQKIKIKEIEDFHFDLRLKE
jgi:RES domain-containing protein